MCWTPSYTRHMTKTNKTKNTMQYVLDTIIHKTHDEDKQNKKHNTICVGHHHTQDKRRRQTHKKHNTKYVGHNYAQTHKYGQSQGKEKVKWKIRS